MFQSRGTIKKKEQKKTLTHHLYFCMRDFGHHLGEDTEIYFSLYDSCKQKYLTERFLVKISKEGFSNYLDKLHSNCTVFTDLGNADLNKDIFIVAHIMRIGRMLYSDSSKKTDKAVAQQQVFKRPHGVAVQNLGDYFTSKEGDTDEKEFTMKVRLYSSIFSSACCSSFSLSFSLFYFFRFRFSVVFLFVLILPPPQFPAS